MHGTKLLFALAGAVLVSTGCDHRLPVDPQARELRSPDAAASSMARARRASAWDGGAGHIEGVIGPGALYAMDVPENWNGSLVVYAHGYNEEPRGIELPDIAYLRDPLLERGYAVAYSSFSQNGYALKEGAQQTHQLLGLFTSEFARPLRAYVAGQSLGGIVALKLAETYPTHYAGALLGCGVVGGTGEEIEYIANVRVLFDYFYPGVLPGSLLEVPAGLDYERDVAPRVVGAILQNPQGAFAMTCILPIPFASPNELVEAIVRALGFQFLGATDFLDRTHGHVFFDNSAVVYEAPCLPKAVQDDLNARVARYQASPDAESYMSHYYQPTGNLAIPVLTLHTTRDPIVPLFNEDRYREMVARAGRSDLLVQRTVPTFGHCTYEAEQLVDAFDNLAAWVEGGVKPTP